MPRKIFIRDTLSVESLRALLSSSAMDGCSVFVVNQYDGRTKLAFVREDGSGQGEIKGWRFLPTVECEEEDE